MKTYLLTSFLSLSCLILPQCNINKKGIETSRPNQVQETRDTEHSRAQTQQIKNHVLALTKNGRSGSSEKETNQTLNYITQVMKGKPQIKSYCDKNGNPIVKNVELLVPGVSDECIIIGAHYDTAEGTPGADDNASAVAALIELANSFVDKKPYYSLLFIAYGNEEPPFFNTSDQGSRAHFETIKNKKDQVKLMICLEMLGYYSNEPGSQSYPIEAMKAYYPDKGDFITIVGLDNTIDESRLIQNKLKPLIPTARLNSNYASALNFSDHAVFNEHGVPAVMITDTAFYRNPHYHEPTDTPDTLNYPNIQRVTEGLRQAIEELSAKPK